MAAPATPAFEFDEETEPNATVENKEVQVFEEMAVARMLTWRLLYLCRVLSCTD
jgi:hypothetical protein